MFKKIIIAVCSVLVLTLLVIGGVLLYFCLLYTSCLRVIFCLLRRSTRRDGIHNELILCGYGFGLRCPAGRLLTHTPRGRGKAQRENRVKFREQRVLRPAVHLGLQHVV